MIVRGVGGARVGLPKKETFLFCPSIWHYGSGARPKLIGVSWTVLGQFYKSKWIIFYKLRKSQDNFRPVLGCLSMTLRPIHTVWVSEFDSFEQHIYAFIENPQFLDNHYETLSKLGTHGYLILKKFRYDWIKIVDFLIKAYVVRKCQIRILTL